MEPRYASARALVGEMGIALYALEGLVTQKLGDVGQGGSRLCQIGSGRMAQVVEAKIVYLGSAQCSLPFAPWKSYSATPIGEDLVAADSTYLGQWAQGFDGVRGKR